MATLSYLSIFSTSPSKMYLCFSMSHLGKESDILRTPMVYTTVMIGYFGTKPLVCVFFFNINLFIYFIFGCVGSSLLRVGFL